MKLSLIVPCYNEAENIPKLHNELLPVIKKLLFRKLQSAPNGIELVEIIFVDDGSQDQTFLKLNDLFGPELSPGLKLIFLRHKTNLGLGAAIRTGFSNAEGDILVTVDSDGTYQFSEIPALLSFFTPEIDIVTASPYHPEGRVIGVPAYRLFLSRGSSFLYRLLVSWGTYTYTSLFRAYRAKVVRDVSFRSNGFLGGTELMIKAMLSGYRVTEFPAVLHKREFGVSKARIFQTILAHLGFQAAVLFYRLRKMIGMAPNLSL